MLDKFKFKPLLPLTSLALASSASLFGESEQEKRVSRLEAKMDALSQTTVQGTVGSNTAIYIPAKSVIVSADLLYWQADQGGLEYAVTSKIPPSATPNIQTHGKTRDLDFDWKPGVRLGIGYHLPYDGWDVFARWTWYQGRADDSVHATSTRAVGMIWSPYSESATNIANAAHGRWKLNYNVIDFELGRHYFVSRALSVRPFIGARGAWIDQAYRVRYDGTQVFPATPTSLSFHGDNDYNAGGLRAGFNLGWHISRKWSVYGDLSGSILFGTFEISEKNVGPSATFSHGTIIDVHESARRTRTNLETGVGVQWETYFTNDKYDFKYHLAIRAGYELVQWFNQNQLSKFWMPSGAAIIKHNGDLGMHGATLSVRFDF